jgi:hypothetical protein
MGPMREVLLFVLCSVGLAHAQAGPGMQDVMHARSYGMGGAYRALGLGAEAVTGNPASMSVVRGYVLELGGAWDPRNPFGFGGVSVMDSQSGPVAGGLAYQLVSVGEGIDQRVTHLNTVSFSVPLGPLHLGGSARHLLSTGAAPRNALTSDAGLLLQLGGFTVSAAGHNLIDVAALDFPRYYSFSGAYLGPMLRVAADVRTDLGERGGLLAYNAGAEWVLGDFLPLRAGYGYDQLTGARSIGAGLGLMLDGMELDLGYRHELGGAFSRLLALTIRMRVR